MLKLLLLLKCFTKFFVKNIKWGTIFAKRFPAKLNLVFHADSNFSNVILNRQKLNYCHILFLISMLICVSENSAAHHNLLISLKWHFSEQPWPYHKIWFILIFVVKENLRKALLVSWVMCFSRWILKAIMWSICFQKCQVFEMTKNAKNILYWAYTIVHWMVLDFVG